VTEPSGAVLAINCGSSTLKAALVVPATGERLLTAYAEAGHGGAARLELDRHGRRTTREIDGTDHATMAVAVLSELDGPGSAGLLAVAHRIVHGGPEVRDHAVVDDAVRAALGLAAELAPLHVPSALAALDAARAALPEVPHVVALDTAFHRTLPEVAYRYAVPESWYADLGVRRYGFHGLSHQSVSEQAADLMGRPPAELRLITLHLGNGCSACAVAGGRSVDTTMGFTPLEGLMMGTRSGDVDPGVLAYVAERTGQSLDALLDTLNQRSGLLGVSGLSADVRDLTRAESDGSNEAARALELYCYRAAKAVAALVVPLGRLDALVLTGGVGEHSARVRAGVVGHLAPLGLTLDPRLNASLGDGPGGRISAEGTLPTWVVATDEELVMARTAAALVGAG
jgi:acetate kinase